MAVQEDPKSVVNSVLRACRVMELLAAEGPEVPLARVAEATNLSRPTAHRLLSTLLLAGWVRRSAAGRYALTMKVFTVGSAAPQGVSLRDLARPALRALAQETGDTAYLLVPYEGKALCVDRVEGPHPVRVHNVNVGDSVPLYSGAAPITILASRPELLEGDAAAKRAARRSAVEARLKMALTDGYVISPDDLLQGVTAVGAPITDGQSIVVGGVSVTGVNDRFDDEHTVAVVAALLRTAAEISRLLGYVPVGADARVPLSGV